MLAIVKFKNGFNYYSDDNAIDDVVNYIVNGAEKGNVGAINVSHTTKECIRQMKIVQKYYKKTGGRHLAHIIVSSKLFDSFDSNTMMIVSTKIANYYNGRYQILYGIHAPTKKGNRHIHYAVNSVSIYGNKIHIGKKDIIDFKNTVENILSKYE